ncbi:hypothetical protein GW17_00023526 [Ensete ventricosum]|nr:hypothetical protein GW17_00023526 [Ensete ventricosum]
MVASTSPAPSTTPHPPFHMSHNKSAFLQPPSLSSPFVEGPNGLPGFTLAGSVIVLSPVLVPAALVVADFMASGVPGGTLLSSLSSHICIVNFGSGHRTSDGNDPIRIGSANNWSLFSSASHWLKGDKVVLAHATHVTSPLAALKGFFRASAAAPHLIAETIPFSADATAPAPPMPTVSVGRDRLFAALGKTYRGVRSPLFRVRHRARRCGERRVLILSRISWFLVHFISFVAIYDIRSLCAKTTEKAIIRKEKHLEEDESDEEDEVIYKIEVAANR